MNTQLPRESGPGKMRADAITIFALGIAAAFAIVTLAVQTFTKSFTPEGIIWQLPVQPQKVTAQGFTAYDADGVVDAEPVSGTLTQLQVTVTDLNTVSTVSLGAAIVLTALTLLTVIASTVRIAWLFQQGRFFTLATSRALRTLMWSLVVGGVGAFAGWNFAKNGVEGALNVRLDQSSTSEWWSWYVITLFAVTSFGLIDIALRRAIRVQHDAEGLV